MNQLAKIGDNNPPDPIDEALAPYADAIAEAENYLDGEPVQTEAQMKAVDALIKDIRSAKTDLAKAKKSATAPFHDIWKNEIARWKPTEDDVERRLKGLAAVVDPFKRQLAEKKEAAKRAAYAEARAKEKAAEEAVRTASASDYEATTEAARLQSEAIEAKKAAAAANKDTVKGLRTVTKWNIGHQESDASFNIFNSVLGVNAFRVDSATNDISMTSDVSIAGDVTIEGKTSIGDGSELTIATGAITITTGFHEVDTEGDAATDDLETINGGIDGQIIVINARNTARTVVVKDNTGNLRLAGDFSMNNRQDRLMLIYDSGTATWNEVSRSDNGG